VKTGNAAGRRGRESRAARRDDRFHHCFVLLSLNSPDKMGAKRRRSGRARTDTNAWKPVPPQHKLQFMLPDIPYTVKQLRDSAGPNRRPARAVTLCAACRNAFACVHSPDRSIWRHAASRARNCAFSLSRDIGLQAARLANPADIVDMQGHQSSEGGFP
jgi:hypothetical protein